MRERHPALHELVEVGRLQQLRAEGVQAVSAMIVGVDVEDVEFAGLGAKCRQDEQHGQSNRGDAGDWLHKLIVP